MANTFDHSAEFTPVSEGSIKDYFQLLKPGVMQLVVFTGFVGLICAPGTIHPVIAIAALLCVAVGAGASGALNMWYEADIDAGMKRTKSRPIPAGKVPAEDALTLGVVLSVGSVFSMALMVNYVSALLLAVTILFYVLVYTMWLKRRTPQNIVIGGAAGATAPMIGWAAVTGTVSLESFALFLLIFMWTPPHFWALALYRAGDYEKVGVPMMPVVAGKASTRNQILVYSVLLVATSFLPNVFGFGGLAYGIVAAITGVMMLWYAARVWMFGRAVDADARAGRSIKKSEVKADHAARAMFHFSNLYLFALFAILLLERGLGFDLATWLS